VSFALVFLSLARLCVSRVGARAPGVAAATDPPPTTSRCSVFTPEQIIMAKGGLGRAPGGKPKGPKPAGGAPRNAGVKKQGKGLAAKLGKKMATGGIKGKGGQKGMQRVAITKPAVQQAFGGSQRHTLVLQQQTAAAGSRTWSDYASTALAVDAFVTGYEAALRKLNPAAKQLTYSVADLHTYIDGMHDLSMLVADPQTKQYAPKGKAFVKAELMKRLAKQAA
jgi:hypothetical protein